jgi:hypothetical protein
LKNRPDNLFFQRAGFFQNVYLLSARKIPELSGNLAEAGAGGGTAKGLPQSREALWEKEEQRSGRISGAQRPKQLSAVCDNAGQAATKRAEKAGTF